MLLFVTVVALAAEPWQVSGELGAEIHVDDSHGIANVAAVRGPWKLQWITDTLDVRYAPEGEQGRAWVGLRAATFAAGMVITPWVDGAPAPQLAMMGAYGGVEAGWIRYLPRGAYAGVMGFARWHGFYGDRAEPLPLARLHAAPQGVLGWWSEPLHAWAVVGVDLQGRPDGAVASVAPHSRGQAVWAPGWVVAPRVELRAGWGEGQDVVTLSRVGGLNPYVVPVAGAAWAEWWVEDYVAVRAGGEVHTPTVDVLLFTDVAAFDGPQGGGTAVGLGLAPTVRVGPVDVALAGGVVPWVERQDGVARWSSYVLVSGPVER